MMRTFMVMVVGALLFSSVAAMGAEVPATRSARECAAKDGAAKDQCELRVHDEEAGTFGQPSPYAGLSSPDIPQPAHRQAFDLDAVALLAWVVGALVCGFIAAQRGRSALGWGLSSLFFSPVLGYLVLVAIPMSNRPPGQAALQ